MGTLRRLTPERHFLSGNRAKPRLRDTRRRIRGSLAARPIRSRLGHRAIPVATGVARSPAPMDQIAPWRFTTSPRFHRVRLRAPRPAFTTAMVRLRLSKIRRRSLRPGILQGHRVSQRHQAVPLAERRNLSVTLRELNRLSANGEVDFSMSYGPSFASVAIERGEFPPPPARFVSIRAPSATTISSRFLSTLRIRRERWQSSII